MYRTHAHPSTLFSTYPISSTSNSTLTAIILLSFYIQKSAATELSKIHPPIPKKLLTFASPLSKSPDVQISSTPSKRIGVLLQKCGIKTVAVGFLTLAIVRILQNLVTQLNSSSTITIKTVQSNNFCQWPTMAMDTGCTLMNTHRRILIHNKYAKIHI